MRPAHTASDDPEQVVAGGDTAEKTSIYKVDSNTWEPGPDMAVGRGYQSQATLSDGEACPSLLVSRHYLHICRDISWLSFRTLGWALVDNGTCVLLDVMFVEEHSAAQLFRRRAS